MASTVWKGQLTFGLVSFPVRLVKAARKERIPLRYVREVRRPEAADQEDDSETAAPLEEPFQNGGRPSSAIDTAHQDVDVEVAPVRQSYFAEGVEQALAPGGLQRGYEIEPEKFVVVRPEELRRLRVATSPEMQILRSVRMEEIDPVFLETSYYVVPGPGGERPYALFYRALTETKYAALAQVAMHGREHVIVVRAGQKGLIAHTMFYVNEVRGSEEYVTNAAEVAGKELDLAKRFVEALAESFRPEEFTDSYRERLQSLISSKEAVPKTATSRTVTSTSNAVDIMEALRKSLETAKARKESARKPPESERPPRKRKRRA